MIQKLSGKALEWWKLLVAYEADMEAHVDGFDDEGLCHDAKRRSMRLRWDFAMMRWGKVWCWDGTGHDDVPSTGYDDVQSYVDNSVMRSGLVIMVSLRGAWASMDGRRGGWLGGLDLIVVEGSSMLKARVRWNGLRRRSKHGLRRRASTLGSCENS